MATQYQKARVRITISDIILIASRKAHISGIEWSINFFTKELDMLKIDVEERIRKKLMMKKDSVKKSPHPTNLNRTYFFVMML